MAESRGLAPQPAEPVHLFSKQRLRLGRFTLQEVPAAGIAPASFRLEGGGLSFSATRSGMDLAAGLPPATRRSKRRMIVISPREEKWSLHEDLHLDLELRGLASCLLDDEGKENGARRRGRTGLVRLTRSARRSLRLTGIGRRAG